MKTKYTSGLFTQRLLQWVSCMGISIQCHMNGAIELLLQLSGIAVVVVGTDTRLAVKVAAVFCGCCGTDGWLTAADAVLYLFYLTAIGNPLVCLRTCLTNK